MAFSDREIQMLYDRYAAVLLHRCRRILRDEALAWDVVHETFARAIVRGDAFRNEASPLTWMYRIGTNLSLNHLRDTTGRGRLLDRRGEELHPGGAEEESASIDHDRVRELLTTADDETRRIVIHTFFDDCTRDEVAHLVGLSVPTVRKRLNAFLDLARATLGASAAAVACLELPWT